MDMNETVKLELERKKHINRWFLVARAQAKTRGEEWLLTFEEYFSMWVKDDRWLLRGRNKDSLCMSRIDMLGPWDTHNVEICTRSEMLRREARMKKEKLQ